MAERYIEYDEALVVQGQFSYRSGLEAAALLCNLARPPTAIFASNDDMAVAAIVEAQRHGFDVPTDISICGFDDTAIATMIWPELSTVRQPIADMARAGIDLVYDHLKAIAAQGSAADRHVLLDHRLVLRQSDASPVALFQK